MQDIAREATMSAGNIYRYFDFKEGIVLGMAVGEQRGSAAVLASVEGLHDKRAILMEVYSRHSSGSRAQRVIRVDIWVR